MDTRVNTLLAGENGNNYIAPFLWLHNEEDSKIITELDRIYECGIRSVCLESRTHEEFCNADWWSDVRLILDYCAKHNMKVWILDDKHFPSGYANGIFETHQELRAWNITENHIDVAGPVTEGCAIADIWCRNEEDELLGVFACKRIEESDVLTDEIIDLSDNLKDGLVYFDLPDGIWRIVYIIKTRRGLSKKMLNYTDRFRAESVDKFIEAVYEKHYDNLKEYFGNTFAGFFSDEPQFNNNSAMPKAYNTEIGQIYTYYPWSDAVLAYFRSLYKENGLRNLLPLWFDFNSDCHMDYRYEYMNCVTKLYKENYTDRIAAWCHRHNVMYIGHVIEDNNAHYRTATGTGHFFRALSGQDMAGIDVVLHQIVPGLTRCANAGHAPYKEMNNKFFNFYLAKLAASQAHFQKEKKGRAMCEIFGAYGWAEGTKIMKYLTDHMLVRGINYFVPHAFSPKENDMDSPPNFYANGTNPQYKYFKYIMAYMNRMCYMLNDGTHISTCAILYDAESHWCKTECIPLEEIACELYNNQLDYDILPADIIAEIDENGKLNDEKYNVLLVPYSSYMPKTVRTKLKNTKIKTVIVSDIPDRNFETVPLSELCSYMRKEGFFDITIQEKAEDLRYFHYFRNGTDIYMFSNEDDRNEIKTKIKIKAFSGGQYILYDAFDNVAYTVTSENGEVDVNLKPYNSCLVIFGDICTDKIEQKKEKKPVKSTQLKPTFDISIARENSDAYYELAVTDTLFNITGRNGISDFSGHIKYKFTCDIVSDNAQTIDLGDVGETAELFVNGKCAGHRLFPPYRFDITDYIVKGMNHFEVIVSNTLGYKLRDDFSKYLMMIPTGILGPITLEENDYI